MSLYDNVSNDDAVACLRLADRIYDRYVLKKGIGTADGRNRITEPSIKGKGRKKESKPRKYGRHNPIPDRLRRRIIALGKIGGAARQTHQAISRTVGLSTCTVAGILRAAGLLRGQGNWKRAARHETRRR